MSWDECPLLSSHAPPTATDLPLSHHIPTGVLRMPWTPRDPDHRLEEPFHITKPRAVYAVRSKCFAPVITSTRHQPACSWRSGLVPPANLTTSRLPPDIPAPPHQPLDRRRRRHGRPNVQKKYGLPRRLLPARIVVDDVPHLLHLPIHIPPHIPIMAIKRRLGPTRTSLALILPLL